MTGQETLTYEVPVGDGSFVVVTVARNPLCRQPLVEAKADHPDYPPGAFDADGYLTAPPQWVCPPHAVVGWMEDLPPNPPRRTPDS